METKDLTEVPVHCDLCGGVSRPARVTLECRRAGSVVLVEGVDVLQCGQCGEKYTPGATARRIEALLTPENLAKAKRVSVPVLELTP